MQGIARNAGLAATALLGCLVAIGSVAATRTGDVVAYGDVGATRTGEVVAYGPAVGMGDGTARVYLELADGRPVELGVALTESALAGLPDAHHLTEFDGHHMLEKILEMPSSNPTPYQYVALGWNPAGHGPSEIYDIPHFDFHFYNVPVAQRQKMDRARPEFDAEAERSPAAELVPAGYVKTPGAVALMGAHWVNPQTPELNGERFTRTFIYGSWDGEIIFAEPMITREFLLTKPDVTEAVPVAAKHAAPGWRPSAYRIRWVESAKEYRVALTGFEWRS